MIESSLRTSIILCACFGEQFKFEEVEPPLSPKSFGTRDFSAGGISSRTLDWDAKFEDNHVEEVETTMKDALSLNYVEARALLGRLEYQRGNYAAALQVFRGIDIRSLIPKMPKSVIELEFQQERDVQAAKECNAILDTVKDALPKGLPVGVFGDCKFQEMFHMALESFPVLWKKAGCLEEAMIERENPEVAFSLGLAAAVSRDINAALESSRDYLHMTMGSSVKGRRLLALVVSAGQSLSEAETVVNLALDETIELDHIGLLRLKCKLQIAQGRPTQAIETYTFLFTLIQAQTRSQTMKSVMLLKRLEAEEWQDLSYINTGPRLWSDASICVNKAMSFGAYSPTNWHAAGWCFFICGYFHVYLFTSLLCN
ncbi:hypothetical protein EJ110_NYTH03760 [Nymphaea thermarum]|nr:hypothetical protein EJ110_NYTH03760 [Nymphaea thermarum]